MSGYPYSRGPSSLSSSFNERARPRPSEDRRYHHTVRPAERTPHYAQVSELYPMQAHSNSPTDFRYRPSADTMIPGAGGVSIPVVHLGSSTNPFPGRSPVATPTVTGLMAGTRGSVGAGGLYRKTTPITTPTSTDPEAEVDALTNVLMQKMETPRSGGIMSSHDTSSDGMSSPVESIGRRGSGNGSGPPRLNRLQQQQTQQRVGSPATVYNSTFNNAATSTTNNNGGSPLTTGSPRNSSPTNSSASSGMGDACQQTNCFRCRRALVPPESVTLGAGTSAPPAVVTLTGALAVRLHESCFTCYLCRTKLNPQGYYHSLHRLLCPTCVRDGAVESCANCRRPIGERIVRALGAPYHPGCFICSMCQTHLDAKPFTVDVHGRPLCLDDFHKRYAPRCAVCSRPIAPEAGSQEARRVVAGNSNYHLSCYGVKAANPAAPSSTPTPSSMAIA